MVSVAVAQVIVRDGPIIKGEQLPFLSFLFFEIDGFGECRQRGYISLTRERQALTRW